MWQIGLVVLARAALTSVAVATGPDSQGAPSIGCASNPPMTTGPLQPVKAILTPSNQTSYKGGTL